MPVFDISDGQGNLSDLASIEVFGRMLFPGGGEGHDQFTSWAFIGALAALSEDKYQSISAPPPQQVLKCIVKAPSYTTVTVESKAARQAGARAAGAILWFVLSCKHNHLDYKPSLNKAWDVLSVAWSRSKTRSASSVSSLKTNWREFKTVAHLWAAFDLFCLELPEDEKSDRSQTYAHLLANEKEKNLFLTFLSMADSLARQAGEIITLGLKKPLVSLPELWMPPNDLLEISPGKGVAIVPGALPPEQIEILKVRRAHSRQAKHPLA